jgi:hypothetical protein
VRKALSNCLKHSNQIHLSNLLILEVPLFVYSFISFSLNTENDIGNEGVIKLSEALKSNTSLTSLRFRGNVLFGSFSSHLMQKIVLTVKQVSNYLKHSNQIHPSNHSSFPVTNRLVSLQPYSHDTVSGISTKGATKLSETLKSNSSLVLLQVSCKTL